MGFLHREGIQVDLVQQVSEHLLIYGIFVLAQPLSPRKKQDGMTWELLLPLRADIPIQGEGLKVTRMN